MRKKTFLIILGVLIVLALPVAFFILTTTMASPEPVTIIAPKTKAISYQNPANRNVQVIIFSSEKIFCYTDNIDSGKIYSVKPNNSFRDYLISLKKIYSDSLVIVLKTTKESTYQSTVDVLDEMTINNIKKFVLVDLNNEEQQKLHAESSGTHPDKEEVTIEKIDTTKKPQKE